MNEITGIGAGQMTTKIKASVEGVKEGLNTSKMGQKPPIAGVREFEIKMEEANHAFVLMTEIREKIESAYNQLTPAE